MQAKIHNVPADRVHVIGYVDFNVPTASNKSRTADLAKALLHINELNSRRNIGVCDFPDVPKASSKRGLADEESDIQTAMWSLKLNCDVRYVQPFELPPHGEAVTKRRTEPVASGQRVQNFGCLNGRSPAVKLMSGDGPGADWWLSMKALRRTCGSMPVSSVWLEDPCSSPR